MTLQELRYRESALLQVSSQEPFSFAPLRASSQSPNFRGFAATFAFIFWVLVLVSLLDSIGTLTVSLLTISALAPIFILSLSKLLDRDTPWSATEGAPLFAWAPYWAAAAFELASVAYVIQLVLFYSGENPDGFWTGYPVFITGMLFFIVGIFLLFPASWNVLGNRTNKQALESTAILIAGFVLVLVDSTTLKFAYNSWTLGHYAPVILLGASYVGLAFSEFTWIYRPPLGYWAARYHWDALRLILPAVTIILTLAMIVIYGLGVFSF